jgi:RNA polymerase sigma-54 factor
MTFSAELNLMQGVGMIPTPALVAYATLLALPGAELEQAVADELAHNPALIQEEAPSCGTCGMPTDPPCPYCAAGAGRAAPPRTADPAGSPGTGPVATLSWAEALLRDLRIMLPSRDATVAAVVVASLDDRGYLTDGTAGLALAARANVAIVERAVQLLRETGPPGVGARDLRDCLLLQIDRLQAQGVTHPLARTVVTGHLEELARGAIASIARQLGVRADDVAGAREFIRRRLHPRPVTQAGPGRDEPAAPVRPDIAVICPVGRAAGFHVEVLEEHRLALRVDPYFRRVAADDPTVLELVKKGESFVARLRERWATMRRVTEYVVGQRPDLLGGEPAATRRLTRAEVAGRLGLSPSTVSRATAGRYVLLPSRRVLPYAAFFDGSLAVRAQLEDLIEAEHRPLSDAELCERLRLAGHHVARRTVAKYRSRLRVLPSTHR